MKIISEFEKNDDQLQILLKSINERDNRQVNGIAISSKKEELEIFLKEHFDISEESLENDKQRKRLDLEITRAEIIIELEFINNEIANSNTQIITINPNLDVFVVDDYDQDSLEVYSKITHLERDIRNMIVNTLESKPNWWTDIIPQGIQDDVRKKIDDQFTESDRSETKLREIDFVDFSHYEEIFKKKGNTILSLFFNGKNEFRWKIISSLENLRELRNKIMHRPPLNADELMSFHTHYSTIKNYVDDAKTLT
jgi:hypothetical protein